MDNHDLRRTTLSALIGAALAAGAATARATEWACAPGNSTFWSQATNWLPAVPGPADAVFLSSPASCRLNTVDRDFSILSLTYRGNVFDWRTELPGTTLAVNGPVAIGVGDPSQSAQVTWSGGGNVRVGSAGSPQTVWIGVNNGFATSGTTSGSLTLEGVGLAGFVSDLSIGRKVDLGFNGSFAGGANGSLVLGSNSTLSVGTAASRANINVGWNQQALGSVTGLFDARQGSVDMHAGSFTVGQSAGGAATGTLRWDRPIAIDATNMFFGRGVGTGILDVASGGTFMLGSAASRVSLLGIAYNDSFSTTGAGLANLDLTVNNPVFAAYLGGELSIGRKVDLGFNGSFAGSANGSLVLGSNSTLSVGTAASRANINVGWNQQALGSVTGLFDARQGSVDMHAGSFTVGQSAGGAATGTLRWDRPIAIDATNMFFGRGVGTGILDVASGGTFMLGSAASRVSLLGIAFNDSFSTTGAGLANLDLTVNNPVFAAYLGGELSIGRKVDLGFNGSFAGGANGSLVLGSNSTLSVGTAASRANINVGWNQQALGSVTGLFDARQGSVDMHAGSFTVGQSAGGAATGTLRWDRPVAIDATNMVFGRGVGTGILDVASGGTFMLGSAASRVSLLGIAYNDSFSTTGAGLANLDLTVNNPVFAAYLGGELSIGRKVDLGFNGSFAGGANGSLVLGSNSTLSVGTAASRANINVGWNQQALGGVTGLLDARQGAFTAFVSNAQVGASSAGSATGTVFTGAQTLIDTTTLDIGIGSNTKGDFHHTSGIVTARTTTLGANGQFIFTGGRFNAIDFRGALVQDGGVLAPGTGADTSKLAISQGYSLASAGTVEIDLKGLVAGSGYDQLVVTGGVDLAHGGGDGGILDVLLGFAPPPSGSYRIIDNDGTDAVLGTFVGLPEGASFFEQFGNQLYRFDISYVGGTGNDVVLNAMPVPEPRTWLLLIAGIAGMLAWSRGRQAAV